MPIIADHLTFVYGAKTPLQTTAVDDISVKIEDGQFIGLIGHTGSGKTTFLQLLSGLIKPSSGTVYINGEDIFAKDFDLHSIRGKVGIVFQYPEHQLFEETVFKDVCFGPKNMGLDQKETELRAYEALKLVGLEDEVFYQSPFDLSGGQKRRVAIAGIIACDPKIIVLDEPTAGLDPKGAKEIINLFVSLNQKLNKTIIIVSHDNEMVYNYCEETVVLSHGQIKYHGSTLDLFADSQLLKQYDLLEPQIVTFKNMLNEKGFRVSKQARTLEMIAKEVAGQLKK